MSAARYWLVGYDIASRRRLRRTHRYLKRQAFPVQYSVFTTRLEPVALDRLLEDLARLIDARRDDVRVRPVPAAAQLDVLGRGLADGIVIALREAGTPASNLLSLPPGARRKPV